MQDSDKRIEKALTIITQFGGIDGAHHKQWVLDQVVRALTGTPMETVTKNDVNNIPYTFERQSDNSQEYRDWVCKYEDGEDGPNTYEWDTGSAP